MTTYRIVIQGEGVNDARTTEDFEEAMDWITNGVEQVADPENPLNSATLEVDGVVWGVIREGGLYGGDDGGEKIIPLHKMAG